MSDKWRELERKLDREDELTEIQFLSEQARLPGRAGWIANRRREFLLTGDVSPITTQPWFSDAIREQYDYWKRVLLSCEPANKRVAENVICDFYALIEEEEPQIVWCDSPLEAARMIGEKNRDNVWDKMHNFQNNLRNALNYNANSQLFYQSDLRFIVATLNRIWNSFAYTEQSLRLPILDIVIDQGDNGTYLFGSMGVYLFSLYYVQRELGVCYQQQDLQILDKWSILAHSCGWWWPYENVCFISDRPQEIELSKDLMTRCVFRDGWIVESEQEVI